MRFHFTTLLNPPQACPCAEYPDELAFLREITDDFKKLIEHYPEGLYPVTIALPLNFESKVTATESIELSLEGTVIYIYTKMFKEKYPSLPYTELQRDRINAIWKGIGHPENIIAS
jgi:hypothetical protein